MDASGIQTQVEKILTVPIKAGFKAGTKITFPKEGDEEPGRVPGRHPPIPSPHMYTSRDV